MSSELREGFNFSENEMGSFLFLFFLNKFILFIFIFGCVGSLLLHVGFL